MPPKRTKKPGLAALSNNSSKESVSYSDKVSRTEVKPLRQTDSKLSATQSTGSRTITLLDLPDEILEEIFRFLTYKQIAHLREICRKIDSVCQSILNSSLRSLQNYVNCKFEKLKAELPRRESTRKKHPLAEEFDIIQTVKIHLVPAALENAVQQKLCCFFPGEILDEANRILHYVKATPKSQLNWDQATKELRELYYMAKEFFEERIDATLPKISFFEGVKKQKEPESGAILVKDLSRLSRSYIIQQSANEDNKEASSNNKSRSDVDDEDKDEKPSKARETGEEIKSNGNDEESESAEFSPTDENSMKQIFAKLSTNIEECNKNFAIVNKNMAELNNNVRLLLLLQAGFIILYAVYFAISGKH